MVFFDQNTPAGEWRAQARCCEEQDIALHRNIAFTLAVADCSNCRTIFRSCRPSRLLCLYRSTSAILRASLT